MTEFTSRVTERIRPVARINPASYSSEQNTARVKASLYQRFLVELHVGSIASGRTVDMDIEQHSVATGGTPKAITGKSITQLTDADSDKIVCVEVRAEELDLAGGYYWISAEVTPTTGVILACKIRAADPTYRPIGTDEWDEVVD